MVWQESATATVHYLMTFQEFDGALECNCSAFRGGFVIADWK